MHATADPTLAIREMAAAFSEVVTGTSCNQSSFKTKRGSFLFIGPGAKGIGYKAMFKLRESMPQAQELAQTQPAQFEVGNTGWVTARFTDEAPLSEAIWREWLQESYDITQGKR
jgi:hypothetical protein